MEQREARTRRCVPVRGVLTREQERETVDAGCGTATAQGSHRWNMTVPLPLHTLKGRESGSQLSSFT